MMRRELRFLAIAALGAILAFCGDFVQRRALGDVFVLASGGQVQGQLLNTSESPRRKYVIRTDDGATITVDQKQLKQIVPVSDAEIEYAKVRPTYPDTAEGQWQLAEWCMQNSLHKQRSEALERVIEHDPEHKQARMGLGYSQIEGRWIRRDEWRRENGYVLHKGQWLLPQEIELLEQRRKAELAQKKWMIDLRKWRAWLNDSSKAQLAEEKLRTIDDANAVPALIKALQDDDPQLLRIVYVHALGRIYSGDAVGALIDLTLGDGDREIRLSALDQLVAKPHANITARFVKELRSKDNVRINRAAHALGKLGDRSAIRPLIDALVTTHTYKVVEGQGSGMSAGFSSDGGGGLTSGSRVRMIRQDISNQSALDALVNLTGLNLDFDETAWRHWYAAQNKATKVNARRD